MRKLAALLIALTVSACAQGTIGSVSTDQKMEVPAGKALMVVGLSVPSRKDSNLLKIIRYDPLTGHYDTNRDWFSIKCRELILETCREITRKAFAVTPGQYVVENWFPDPRFKTFTPFVAYNDSWYFVCQNYVCSPMYQGTATVLPTSQVVEVKAGEVVYVGDLVVAADKGVSSASLGPTVDEQGARALLAASGLADRMIVRPFAPYGKRPAK